MDSANRELPSEAGTGAGALVDSIMTAPVTPSGDHDAEASLIADPGFSEATNTVSGSPTGNYDEAGEAASGTTSPASQEEDQSLILSRIKKLQDELVRLEKGTRLKEGLENVESKWDKMFERVGGDEEQRNWARMQDMKAHSYARDTAAFAFGREWVHESEDSFIRYMMEREEHNKQLIQRRAQWEAKKGIERPTADDTQKPTQTPGDPHRLLTTPAFLDPMSSEAVFNSTDIAQGYDLREHQLRSQIHEVVRGKFASFVSWKQSRPNLQPKVPDPKLENLRPRPIANYVPWKDFRNNSPLRAFNTEEKQHLFALDVLDGEPDPNSPIMIDNPVIARIPTAVPKLSQGLLPERILLNGRHFSETFRDLESPLFSNFTFSPSQTTLLQPYRLLIYHEKQIRDRYEFLKTRFEKIEGPKDISNASLLQVPEHLDTRRADAGQEACAASKTASKEGEVGASSDPDHQKQDALQHEKPEKQQEESKDKLNKEVPFPLAISRTAMDYLGLLLDFMDSTISIRKNYVQGMDCRKVHFRDLWYLFSPGDEVISRDGRQVHRVIEVTNPRHRESSRNIFFDYDDKDRSRNFQLSCVHVDFDGKKIGPVSTTFVIKTFAGERPVESLEVYPLRLHRPTSTSSSQSRKNRSFFSDSQTLRQELIKRGKKFFQAACMNLEHTFYDGPTTAGDEVESQVVVDFETALSSGKNFDEGSVPKIKSLLGDADDSASTSSGSDDDLECLGPCCIGLSVRDDSFVDEKRREEYIDSLIPKTHAKLPSVVIYPRNLEDTTGDNILTDDEYLLMSYRVFAFVLRTRKWAELDLTYMEDAAENEEKSNKSTATPQSAFEQLVLPEGHKNIVLSLISQHYRNKDSGRRSIDQSDIVRGKGKGLILLLHGAPGVGKTSTAEGIAEKFKKPLFTITCGDLGSTAKEVEEALDLNFNLANRWGCILLLDEADVFLSSRTESDFERNGLVAVFLRVLEYYAGILFLTTNRVGVIDEAFRSRIHISLYYPPLGHDETRAVFKLNLKLIQDRFNHEQRNINIERDEIIDFALDYFRANERARWNGRQIRNACQTALALAEFKAQGGDHDTVLDPNADVCLAVENFKTVSKAYLEFTRYLKQLYGIHEDVRAKELGLRARETNRQPQAQSNQSPLFGGIITQPGSTYGRAQSYNNQPVNPVQTAHTQQYQINPIPGQIHMNPNLSVQQPGQQFPYYGNPAQVTPAGNFNNYGASGQALSGQLPQSSQEYVGMQFQPAQGSTNQQGQPWMGPASSPDPASMPQQPPAQGQQQYQAQAQQSQGTAHLESHLPTSQGYQTHQSMPPQHSMQQQAPQTWYPNMSSQNMQPAGGQNPPGPAPQEGGR